MLNMTSGLRRGWAAAAALLLVPAMLLCGCSKRKAAAENQTVPPPASLEISDVPADTTAAPVETEPSVPETIALPEDWNPSLNSTDISFFGPGESFVLTVKNTPAGIEILWTSENEEVAAVDDTGRVTAVGPGSARVFAEVRGVKLVCWIRCVFSAAAEDEPTLNKTDISFFGPGENFVLAVQNAPENAEILWTSGDPTVAAVDGNGHVYAVGPGTIKVSAQVNGHVLSCWVRCQFPAPEVPRCTVADGKYLFLFQKDQITAPDENGYYTAEATLLRPVQLSEDKLRALANGGELDLTARGLGVFAVESVSFSDDETQCTLHTSDAELVFERTEGLSVTENTGAWTMIDPNNGAPCCFPAGTCRLVFSGSTACLDEMSAVLEGTTGTIRRGNLLEFFGRNGFGDEVWQVGITVRNGFVTEAIWYYHP